MGRTESHISHLEFLVIFLKFSNVQASHIHVPRLENLADEVVATDAVVTADFESGPLDDVGILVKTRFPVVLSLEPGGGTRRSYAIVANLV